MQKVAFNITEGYCEGYYYVLNYIATIIVPCVTHLYVPFTMQHIKFFIPYIIQHDYYSESNADNRESIYGIGINLYAATSQ